MNLQDAINVIVTRNPSDTIQIIHTIVLIFSLFVFQYFMRKILEVDKKDRKKYCRGFIVSIILPIIFSVLFLKIEFLWLFAFIYVFIAFQNFFIKSLEDFSLKWITFTMGFLIILIIMINFSIHYPSINLQIILKDYLGILK